VPDALFIVLVIVILMPIILGIGIIIAFRRLRRRLDNRIGKIEKHVASLKSNNERTRV